jgi:hypothetical protein
VVETIRLESGHTLTGIGGSNPSLSARILNPSSLLTIPIPCLRLPGTAKFFTYATGLFYPTFSARLVAVSSLPRTARPRYQNLAI